MADLLAYGRANERLAQISANGLDYGNAQRRMARVTGIHSSLSTLITNLGLWTILLLCIPQVTSGNLAGPMLASLTLLTFASFEAVTPLALAAQMWNSSREAAKKLFEVVDTEPEIRDEGRVTSNKEEPLITHNSLLVTDLSFAYPHQTIPALQHVTFNLQPGNSIAIVGPSGAGKSTLANLFLRFWDYEIGEISLNGESLKVLNQDEVRAKIGLVSQNTYFFNTSIYENLRFARRKVSREEIESAAKAAQIHDFIMNLPKGYDTMIGEQGLRLSGGERQRLAIARVLIKDAPILILDEPTSNLDPTSERLVLEALERIDPSLARIPLYRFYPSNELNRDYSNWFAPNRRASASRCRRPWRASSKTPHSVRRCRVGRCSAMRRSLPASWRPRRSSCL
jgi:ATP-binding cassette subfamily C protein CydC